jgi:urease beta subunit
MKEYEVKEVVGLPVMEEREVWPGVRAQVAIGKSKRFEPGDTITEKDLQEAGQNAEQIQSLIDHAAIAEKSDEG